MTSDRWERIKDIFEEALEHAPPDREAFIRRAAQDDPSLTAELLQMLKENASEYDLSNPALGGARGLTTDETPRFAPSALLAHRFRVVRLIARGGMGEVYEAEDIELGERVALKAIRPGIASDDDLRALFLREIQLSRRVTHPNVCRIFDLEQHEANDGQPPALLLSMELIEGQTLAEYIRANGPLSVKAALPLIEDVAAGLQAVHDAGIVHGDLKPGNIMLVRRPGESTRAIVMDFGLAFPAAHAAERHPAGSPLSPSGRLVRGGTPDFLAPEQEHGELASARSDIFAFALVIGNMLGVSRTLHSGGVPAAWMRILKRCLDNDPSARYTSPAEMARDLRAALNRRAKHRRILIIAACAMAAIFQGAKRLDMFQGTANRMILTEGSGLTIHAPSPDGKAIAATSWDTGDLVLRELSTGATKRLTRKRTTWAEQFGGAFGALFSPDGSQIAYEWMNSRTDGELRLISPSGKGDRTLYHQPNSAAALVDWSPDGSRILIRIGADPKDEQRYALLTPADGTLKFLDNQPSVRQGGRVHFGLGNDDLVFDAMSPAKDRFEIHRLSLRGQESTLVANAGNSSLIGWSPGRRRLLFTTDRRGQPSVWAVPISPQGAAGEPAELVANARKWEAMGITRDGALFYRHNADSVDVYTAVLDLDAGRTVSPPKRISERFVGSFAYPNWSEDGAKLVFDSNRDQPVPGLGIYDLKSSQLRELRPDLAHARRPQWVEHGAAIIVTGKSLQGEEGHFRVDAASGAVSLFQSAKQVGSMFEGLWSSDEKIHFNRFQINQQGIFRLDLPAGRRQVLYVPPPGTDVGTENLALSPDGKTLAFHARQEGGAGILMVVPAAGGEPRPLLTVKSPERFWFGSFAWTRDSSRILAVRSHNRSNSPGGEVDSEIWQVPVNGGPPSKIDFPPLFVECLRLNPDGKTIAFHVRQWRSEIWVLQKFL